MYFATLFDRNFQMPYPRNSTILHQKFSLQKERKSHLYHILGNWVKDKLHVDWVHLQVATSNFFILFFLILFIYFFNFRHISNLAPFWADKLTRKVVGHTLY